MPIEWFNRHPGDAYAKPTDESDPLGEQLIVFGGQLPNWVRLPEELGSPLAGRTAKVVRHFKTYCPKCKAVCSALELAEPDGLPEQEEHLYTTECTACKQFCVYRATYAPS